MMVASGQTRSNIQWEREIGLEERTKGSLITCYMAPSLKVKKKNEERKKNKPQSPLD